MRDLVPENNVEEYPGKIPGPTSDFESAFVPPPTHTHTVKKEKDAASGSRSNWETEEKVQLPQHPACRGDFTDRMGGKALTLCVESLKRGPWEAQLSAHSLQ